MILDFEQFKRQKFKDIAIKIREFPNQYLDFETVADFYQASFLSDFPQGTIWTATGLDDGAEQFYAIIEYKDLYIKINKDKNVEVKFGSTKGTF